MMKNYVTIFLFMIYCNLAGALVPIEGIIYGDVQDIKQYDPFAGMLTYKYDDNKEIPAEYDKLIYYLALYKQGISLDQRCESLSKIEYSNFWTEDTAKRSVIATLQYIVLDLTIKSIANFSKKFEFSDEKYTTLYTNLVKNTCSQNISTYSHKMLMSNFKHYWRADTGFKNPTIEESPFFNVYLKKKHNTKATFEKEFEYSLRNFRAFCSWNSDASSLGLIEHYLKNPFIMSYVFNNLLQRKITVDKKTEEIILKKSDKGIQVACENMICRKRDKIDFKKYFPRIHGSSKLQDDLNILYCSHFKKHRDDETILSKKLKKWNDDITFSERSMESMHLLSLISGFPDFTIISTNYKDVLADFKDNIQFRWNRWAWEKSTQLNLEQLYEEPLEVSLESQINSNAIELGNFNLKFNVELGEMDKVLGGHDKISSHFNLTFPVSYINYLKERIPFLYNTDRHNELQAVEKRFVINIKTQLEKKKKYFKVPIWNDSMPTLIATELLGQINRLNKYRFNKLSKETIHIPVEFNFGIFALQYIRKKYIYRHSTKKSVSFN